MKHSKNDATPSDNGARAKESNTSPNHTQALFQPPAHHNAPATSRQAADRIRGFAPTLEARVLAAIRAKGAPGATDQELQIELSLSSDTEVPRRNALVKRQIVVSSGRTRKTRSGRNAIVWVVSECAPGREGGSQ